MTRRARGPSLWDETPRSGRNRGRQRRAAEATVRAWRSTGKLEDADAALVALLYAASDELDTVRSDPDESAYVRAVVLGRATDVTRFVVERVGHDIDPGPSLADLLAATPDTEDAGPPD